MSLILFNGGLPDTSVLNKILNSAANGYETAKKYPDELLFHPKLSGRAPLIYNGQNEDLRRISLLCHNAWCSGWRQYQIDMGQI